MTEPAGTSPDSPIFMRLIKDEQGVKWGNLLLMLGVTVVSGFLASRAQRWGAQPDIGAMVRMRLALAGQTVGNRVTSAGVRFTMACAREYDKASA